MMIAKAKGRKQTLNNNTINRQWWQLQSKWQGNSEAMVMATMARGSSTSTSHQQAQQSSVICNSYCHAMMLGSTTAYGVTGSCCN